MRFLIILPLLAVVMIVFLSGCTSSQPPAAQPGTGNQAANPPVITDLKPNNTNAPNQSGQLVGNDKDAHGCIPSAGYTWCEEKQKCLRVWEENCTSQLANAKTCIVYIQKTSSDIYLIDVRNVVPAGSAVTVRCPNGQMGADRGQGLFYCDHLTPNDNVTAYADGIQCGARSVSESSQVPGTSDNASSGVAHCSLNLSLSTVRAGGEFYADLAYETSQNSIVEFTCGGQTKQLAAGIGTRSLICTFNETGLQDVILWVDGQPCAAAQITVQ